MIRLKSAAEIAKMKKSCEIIRDLDVVNTISISSRKESELSKSHWLTASKKRTVRFSCTTSKSRHFAELLVQTIQRVATEAAIENSVTVFNIDSDEIKGRIIGREGRNIRTLEAATGVEIIVDDTPEAIVLSAFDPVRHLLRIRRGT